MEHIDWEVQYLSLPAIRRHCQKCGGPSRFVCSGNFRVNAQRKSLDIWLIYRCACCHTTYNMDVYSRVRPDSIPPSELARFLQNDEQLAWRYATDNSVLQKNGVVLDTVDYRIQGLLPTPQMGKIQLQLHSRYALPVRVGTVLRKKMEFSADELKILVESGRIWMDGSDRRWIRRKLFHGCTLYMQLPPKEY
ncbi:Uncharacterized protein conserved in bacteria [Anaerotruncus sp. 2789STDY5834896]|uniref:Uncharacterized protein conserved in bacteria n=1 Tax=uncultured Anaerotruncus sp. TaxID=905011 RepID=A0A1C6J2J0_9FIRM|nr:Uncharacterized protein conserved in bacteria [uncultured Anaerotruncus sp.]